MQYLGKNRASPEQMIDGVISGDRVQLSMALSLVESSLQADSASKLALLEGILDHTGNSIRIGITGAPGVGKSTFIEAMGSFLVDKGHRLAVLTVDPTSRLSHGSILGDKTRMEQLSRSEHAFIRPSAAGTSLGGVARHTRESILLCEAAGFDVIIVETVGVGQSEIEVRNMVDFFLLVLIAGAGDELQGIKKGIIEMADSLIINKADGDELQKARQAQSIYQNALQYLTPVSAHWQPKVFTCSAQNGEGIEPIWSTIESFRAKMQSNGNLEERRRQQRALWLEDCINQEISRYLKLGNKDAGLLEKLEQQVSEGKLLPAKAAELVLQKLIESKG